EAVEHLVEDAYRDALVEKLILPLNQAKIDVQQAEEGKALVFSATVAVRPDVKLGDYRDFNFKPEIEQITDVTVDKVINELRDQILPDTDDEFARGMGDYADLPALRAEVQQRLERNALDRARHQFADRIIEYAVANATMELPDILVDQEVEVMHDEFR